MNIDGSTGYIAMIQRLRVLFQSASKPYIITGAPQYVKSYPLSKDIFRAELFARAANSASQLFDS